MISFIYSTLYYGVSTLRCSTCIFRLKISDNSFDASVAITIPKCKAEADYDFDGQILMLPITGNGKCSFEFGKRH